MTFGELITRIVHGIVLRDASIVRAIAGTVCATENMGSFEVMLRTDKSGEADTRIRVTVERVR